MSATISTCRTTTEPCWYEAWFDSPHYQALYAHRDEREAAAFVAQALRPGGWARPSDIGVVMGWQGLLK